MDTSHIFTTIYTCCIIFCLRVWLGCCEHATFVLTNILSEGDFGKSGFCYDHACSCAVYRSGCLTAVELSAVFSLVMFSSNVLSGSSECTFTIFCCLLTEEAWFLLTSDPGVGRFCHFLQKSISSTLSVAFLLPLVLTLNSCGLIPILLPKLLLFFTGFSCISDLIRAPVINSFTALSRYLIFCTWTAYGHLSIPVSFRELFHNLCKA